MKFTYSNVYRVKKNDLVSFVRFPSLLECYSNRADNNRFVGIVEICGGKRVYFYTKDEVTEIRIADLERQMTETLLRLRR